jgi:hypothetical protein
MELFVTKLKTALQVCEICQKMVKMSKNGFKNGFKKWFLKMVFKKWF